MFTKKVKVTKKIFLSSETGFGVFKVTAAESRESEIITGSLFDVKEGDFLEINGEYTVHPRFGRQVKVSGYRFIQPEDTEGIEKFLSLRIKGIGPKTARKIVTAWGRDTLKILETNPEKLSRIKGIRKSIIDEVKKDIQENKIMRNLTVQLSPYGIGNETIFKIYREFGDSAFEITRENPYLLIDRIKGVGFKTADTIAQGFGMPKNDPRRISSGIDFVLSQAEQNNGDLYSFENELTERCSWLLDLPPESISEEIENKRRRNELIREDIPEKIIVSYKNYYIEKSIADSLYTLTTSVSQPENFSLKPGHIHNRLNVRLSEEQKNAIGSALKNKFTIITGGPGTGKTTLIRAIIESTRAGKKRILIAAPTGRAAKRIEETSHYQASTIHRMLKLNPETREFTHNGHNPLIADVIIIDEFSMVDVFLFYSLLRAVTLQTRLIIIGDKDQLPSVGPGNVLRDMIKSDYFNTIYLSRNYRQTENSLIIENAYRINQGEQLVLHSYSDSLDFVFVRVQNENQALQKALKIMDFHKNQYPANSNEMQVLVPMYRGEAGIDNLNTTIQDRFNPGPHSLVYKKFLFKPGDKVMQLKNNYEKEIFNGEMGIIRKINPEGQICTVDYDGYLVEYQKDEMDELTPAYAISIHKSQGSEYDIVILVLLPSHSIMLNREIFYTAVTRAKKKIFLLSDEDTIHRALINRSPRQRKTLLPRRLKNRFENLK